MRSNNNTFKINNNSNNTLNFSQLKILLDSYDDIFSDFDSSAYYEKTYQIIF